ncbi:hypothetical protein BDZ91DRAFT_734381 [Kalaharituber pfeilii]|nr:hypothetical protein BDZ91DRAFT_734381 [Kalaharituber pfeilii]
MLTDISTVFRNPIVLRSAQLALSLLPILTFLFVAAWENIDILASYRKDRQPLWSEAPWQLYGGYQFDGDQYRISWFATIYSTLLLLVTWFPLTAALTPTFDPLYRLSLILILIADSTFAFLFLVPVFKYGIPIIQYPCVGKTIVWPDFPEDPDSAFRGEKITFGSRGGGDDQPVIPKPYPPGAFPPPTEPIWGKYEPLKMAQCVEFKILIIMGMVLSVFFVLSAIWTARFLKETTKGKYAEDRRNGARFEGHDGNAEERAALLQPESHLPDPGSD